MPRKSSAKSHTPGSGHARAPLAAKAREAMEKLNGEAGHLNIWLRTQANAPSQKPWFTHTDAAALGEMAQGKVAAGQMKASPHHWKWREISPYLDKIAQIAATADVPPVEFAERQQFLLTNPGLNGRLQVASTIRCAVSIYNPGDLARAHLHTPNASRTILSEHGGYTNVEGERLRAVRGDLILTPTGTWHDHGNDDKQPVVWIDTLDWPILEFLDCIWLDEDMPAAIVDPRANVPIQKSYVADGYSQPRLWQGRPGARVRRPQPRHRPGHEPQRPLSRRGYPRRARRPEARRRLRLRRRADRHRQPRQRRLAVCDARLRRADAAGRRGDAGQARDSQRRLRRARRPRPDRGRRPHVRLGGERHLRRAELPVAAPPQQGRARTPSSTRCTTARC